MEIKHLYNRSFLLTATLIVLSIMAVLYNGVLIYTGFFFAEAQSGLEIYLSDTFTKYPFKLIYILLLGSGLILLVSVVLMWMKERTGVFLYLFWSFVIILLLLFAEPIDWFNVIVLLIIAIVLILNSSYFSVKNLGVIPKGL